MALPSLPKPLLWIPYLHPLLAFLITVLTTRLPGCICHSSHSSDLPYKYFTGSDGIVQEGGKNCLTSKKQAGWGSASNMRFTPAVPGSIATLRNIYQYMRLHETLYQLRKGGFAADEPSKILYIKKLRDHRQHFTSDSQSQPHAIWRQSQFLSLPHYGGSYMQRRKPKEATDKYYSTHHTTLRAFSN